MVEPTPIAVLLSGRGSNFLALQGAIERGELAARIALVVSNVDAAPGLERARELGLSTMLAPHAVEPDRESHEARIAAALVESGAAWVCLAGYMRRLSASFVARWPERILNIHPSLLPAFPGLHPQRQALAAGVRVSGCTVHLVDEGLDSGPIVHQRAVPVLDADDESTLAARILVEEHRAYPEALQRLLECPWRIDGRRVRFGACARAADAAGGLTGRGAVP
jgi:phosphoribosylglycinamide formyltransferase-1